MESTRNLTLAGHGNSGKTTLAEAFLFRGGVIGRMGSVEDGTTVSDYTPIEKDRKNSLIASVMHLPWRKTFLNLIDTPGFSDFLGEAISGVRAADTVLVAVAANNGIQVNTRTLWKEAGEAGKARALVVTKLDAENVDFAEVLAEIQKTFGDRCKAVTVPVDEGPGLSAVTDVLATKEHEDREALVEMLLESDDALMEKYLEGEELTDEELHEAFRKGMVQGSFVPVFSVSAARDLGVDTLLDYVAAHFPSPADVPTFRLEPSEEGEEGEVLAPSEDGPFAAQVFKTVTDDYVGKLNFFRVVRGRIEGDANVVVAGSGDKVRLQNTFRLQGKEQEAADILETGHIYAVSKLENLSISDTLCAASDVVRLRPLAFPEPMVFLALSPKSRQDEQRISGALAKLSGEDPTFKIERNAETKELVASGMSQLHLDIKLKALKARFNVEVDTKTPRIPYRETINAKATSKYRHKKQTGGAGQFAEVWLRVEPLRQEDGSFEGFAFESEVFGGAISQPFIPSIEKGIRAVMKEGVIAGYPIDGVKAVVYDGKEHPVDSKDIAFQIAGREAFKLAVKDARPVLLEPIMDVEVSVPSEVMGEVTGDLNTRRGRIQGMQAEGNWQIITAKVPQADLLSYSTDLRSLTGGEASFTMKFSHYDVVPSNIASDVIARSARKDESDK